LDKTAIEHKTRQSGCCSNLFTFACAPTLLEIVREHCIESWRHPYQLRRGDQASSWSFVASFCGSRRKPSVHRGTWWRLLRSTASRRTWIRQPH